MLRTDLFKTRNRDTTQFICVRDSLTQRLPHLDVIHFDNQHGRRGAFGIGWHFLIKDAGQIELARDVHTIGSHSQEYDHLSVAIGVVGGVSETGEQGDTRTPEQLEALSDLLEVLIEMYPTAVVKDRPVVN